MPGEVNNLDRDVEPEFVCIECMAPAHSLYTQYSKDVVRITECNKCGSVVDKYVEWDLVLVLIDLVLQYQHAYRHILINSRFKSFKRVIFIFLLCNAYKAWIERRSTEENSTSVFDLEWKFYECLGRSAVEFGAYALTLLALRAQFGDLEKQILPKHARISGRPFLAESALVGFHGSLFVVFSIIWQLHRQWSYRALSKVFILLSHLQIQRALFPNVSLWRSVLMISLSVGAQTVAGKLAQSLIELL